jgi:hypothetical protein
MPRSIPTAFRIVVWAACFAALTSCASTELSEAWFDSSYTGGPLESVLVVGVSDNVRRRGLFEQELTSRFNSRGVAAVASMSVAPTVEDLDEESVKKKARELDIESVIVTKLLSVDKERYYVSGQPTRYYGYYDRATGRELSPGFWAEYEIVKLETNLYDVASDKLIWSAASETFDPPPIEKFVQSLSKKIIDDLTKRGLLTQK